MLVARVENRKLGQVGSTPKSKSKYYRVTLSFVVTLKYVFRKKSAKMLRDTKTFLRKILREILQGRLLPRICDFYSYNPN